MSFYSRHKNKKSLLLFFYIQLIAVVKITKFGPRQNCLCYALCQQTKTTKFLCWALTEKEGFGQAFSTSPDLAPRLPFVPHKGNNPTIPNQQMPSITSLFLLTFDYKTLLP